MSWFPGGEISDDPSYTNPIDGFLRTSPSPRPSQHHDPLGIASNTRTNDFQETSCPSWHAPTPHGLGLFNLPMTTDAGSDVVMASEPYPYQYTTASFAWPSTYISSAPFSGRMQPDFQDSWSDQSCDPLSTLLPGALYDHLRPDNSFVAGYETSPGRSEYSRSTQPSAVSSPCTSSDLYVHRVDSPQIKIEYPLDHIPQINFVSEHHEHQDSKIDDFMTEEESSIEERLRSVMGSSSSSDHGDYKFHAPRPVHRRAHSFADFGEVGLSHRRKRTRTKPENARIHCDQCGKPFQRAYNLKSHISNVHNKHRVKNHACDRDGCTYRFQRNTDLRRHIESVHDKLRQHICELCGKNFPRKDTLTRHVDDGCPRREKVRKSIKKSPFDMP